MQRRNKVRRLPLPPVVLVALALIGCGREQGVPPPPAEPNPGEGKPFAISSSAGIEHEFYRDMSPDSFLKLLPANSVDSLNVNFDNAPHVFALVKVPDQPGRDLSKVRFETTFKNQDGRVIDKHWTAAEGRKSGPAVAAFSLPPTVVEGQTKVVPTGD
jgi:hypothetical protein